MTDAHTIPDPAGSRHVTINDVARYARLSVATVSRVMHDNPRVSPDARRRVQKAIEVLGYTPNGLARGLAMSSTHTIGILVASLSDPFWAEVVRGIEDYAHAERYSVLVASSYEDSERERSALELFNLKRVDGLVVGGSSGGPQAIRETGARHLPAVFVNDEHVDINTDENAAAQDAETAQDNLLYLVRNDDIQGAFDTTTHLIDQGHRRIAYIGAIGRASSLRRLRGYRMAVESAGRPIDESLIAVVGEGANDGELAAFRLLVGDIRPTALFCYDDMTALGALRAIRALKLAVPDDISVVGFDDIPIAAYLEPALTTVRQPIYEMGRQAMHLLLGSLRGEEPQHIVTMPGELIVRASSGPAPGMSRQ